MILDKNNYNITPFHNAPIIDDISLDRFNSRLLHLKEACNKCQIDGEILEFGVYKGTTINFLASLYPTDRVWGFDSFEGLPEDWRTVNHRNPFPKGHFKLDTLPIVANNVNLVQGYFNDSIPKWLNESNISNIKILHIDCDLYSSTKTVLFNLNNKIISGTVIIFDELYNWGSPKKYINWQDGEYSALGDWIKEYNREISVICRNRYMQSSILVIK